jgi:hypothetical protein
MKGSDGGENKVFEQLSKNLLCVYRGLYSYMHDWKGGEIKVTCEDRRKEEKMQQEKDTKLPPKTPKCIRVFPNV